MAPKPLFELIDHCCRLCGGRLLQRSGEGGPVQVRCAECAALAECAPHERLPYAALCFCGVRLASGADAGLRCRRAEKRSPERPQEVVVRHEPAPDGKRRRPVPRTIRTGDDADDLS